MKCLESLAFLEGGFFLRCKISNKFSSNTHRLQKTSSERRYDLVNTLVQFTNLLLSRFFYLVYGVRIMTRNGIFFVTSLKYVISPNVPSTFISKAETLFLNRRNINWKRARLTSTYLLQWSDIWQLAVQHRILFACRQTL